MSGRIKKSTYTPRSPPNDPKTDNHYVAIGIIYSNGTAYKDVYRCPKKSCSEATFNRLADLKRHHASKHEGFVGKQVHFWCPIDGCEFVALSNVV